MNVVAFYDTTEAQSLICAAIVRNKWPNVSLQDTAGLNEAAIIALIAAISAASQHRIYILVGVAGGHVAGNLTTAQVTALDAKLYTSAVDPDSDDACRERGVTSGDDYAARRTWDDIYSTITPPPMVFYNGGIGDTGVRDATFCDFNGTATSGAATSLTDTSNTFVADALIGKYLYVLSGTGIGQYATITDNTTTKITIAAWSKDAGAAVTTDNTSVYRVVSHSDRILIDGYLPYAILTYLTDLTDTTTIQNWTKLIDSNGNLEETGLNYGSYDDEYYEEIRLVGKNIWDYTNK